MAANSVEIDKKIFLLNTDEKTHNLKRCYRNYKSKMDYHTRDFNIYKMIFIQRKKFHTLDLHNYHQKSLFIRKLKNHKYKQ